MKTEIDDRCIHHVWLSDYDAKHPNCDIYGELDLFDCDNCGYFEEQ